MTHLTLNHLFQSKRDMATSTVLAGTPNLTAVHAALQADARLVQMQMQAQVSDRAEQELKVW
jgi:hypothetical protein